MHQTFPRPLAKTKRKLVLHSFQLTTKKAITPNNLTTSVMLVDRLSGQADTRAI
jgi:hypothetical protein